MFQVTVDNSQFEDWANVKLPQNIMEIMNWLAYQTELKMEAVQFKRPTGKTKAAITGMQQAKRTGDTFESGVGDMNKVGVSSDTAAPPNTIRDFKSWLEGELMNK